MGQSSCCRQESVTRRPRSSHTPFSSGRRGSAGSGSTMMPSSRRSRASCQRGLAADPFASRMSSSWMRRASVREGACRRPRRLGHHLVAGSSRNELPHCPRPEARPPGSAASALRRRRFRLGGCRRRVHRPLRAPGHQRRSHDRLRHTCRDSQVGHVTKACARPASSKAELS